MNIAWTARDKGGSQKPSKRRNKENSFPLYKKTTPMQPKIIPRFFFISLKVVISKKTLMIFPHGVSCSGWFALLIQSLLNRLCTCGLKLSSSLLTVIYLWSKGPHCPRWAWCGEFCDRTVKTAQKPGSYELRAHPYDLFTELLCSVNTNCPHNVERPLFLRADLRLILTWEYNDYCYVDTPLRAIILMVL